MKMYCSVDICEYYVFAVLCAEIKLRESQRNEVYYVYIVFTMHKIWCEVHTGY